MRKAITAAVLACLFALATAVVDGRAPQTAGGWLALATMAVGSGVLAGVAVYRVTNEGSDNGSYLRHAFPFGPTTRTTDVSEPVTRRTFRPGRSDGTQMDPTYDPPSGSMNPHLPRGQVPAPGVDPRRDRPTRTPINDGETDR